MGGGSGARQVSVRVVRTGMYLEDYLCIGVLAVSVSLADTGWLPLPSVQCPGQVPLAGQVVQAQAGPRQAPHMAPQ